MDVTEIAYKLQQLGITPEMGFVGMCYYAFTNFQEALAFMEKYRIAFDCIYLPEEDVIVIQSPLSVPEYATHLIETRCNLQPPTEEELIQAFKTWRGVYAK